MDICLNTHIFTSFCVANHVLVRQCVYVSSSTTIRHITLIHTGMHMYLWKYECACVRGLECCYCVIIVVVVFNSCVGSRWRLWWHLACFLHYPSHHCHCQAALPHSTYTLSIHRYIYRYQHLAVECAFYAICLPKIATEQGGRLKAACAVVIVSVTVVVVVCSAVANERKLLPDNAFPRISKCTYMRVY